MINSGLLTLASPLLPPTQVQIWELHLQLKDFDTVPMVPQLLLQLRDGLLQSHDLLLPLLVLMQPIRNLVCAAEHIGAPPLVHLGQRGHQATHPVLHQLPRTRSES